MCEREIEYKDARQADKGPRERHEGKIASVTDFSPSTLKRKRAITKLQLRYCLSNRDLRNSLGSCKGTPKRGPNRLEGVVSELSHLSDP